MLCLLPRAQLGVPCGSQAPHRPSLHLRHCSTSTTCPPEENPHQIGTQFNLLTSKQKFRGELQFEFPVFTAAWIFWENHLLKLWSLIHKIKCLSPAPFLNFPPPIHYGLRPPDFLLPAASQQTTAVRWPSPVEESVS